MEKGRGTYSLPPHPHPVTGLSGASCVLTFKHDIKLQTVQINNAKKFNL